MTVKEAHERLHDVLAGVRSDELPEACEPLNKASLELIEAAYREWPECWLVSINGPADDPERIYWQHDGGPVHNFDADWVLPCKPDGIAAAIVRFRQQLPSYAALLDIERQLRELGGMRLYWT